MKKLGKFLIILIPIIATIIGTSYGFILNRQTVDVRYTLSENIPINVSNQSSSENVQQLVIKNLGNTKAENIVIDIQGKVTNYNVIKYSENDKEQNYSKSDGGIQLIYPELPPQGSFNVVIKSEGKGINIGDVTIKHSKGKAVEALSNDREKTSPLWIVFIFGVYAICLLFYMKIIFTESWERKSIQKYYFTKVLSKKDHLFI